MTTKLSAVEVRFPGGISIGVKPEDWEVQYSGRWSNALLKVTSKIELVIEAEDDARETEHDVNILRKEFALENPLKSVISNFTA